MVVWKGDMGLCECVQYIVCKEGNLKASNTDWVTMNIRISPNMSCQGLNTKRIKEGGTGGTLAVFH